MATKTRTIIDIANEYVTQDNLGTRHPILVLCTELKKIPNPNGEGEHISVYNDGDTFEPSKKSIMEDISYYLFDNTEYKYLDWDQKEKYQDIKLDLDSYGIAYVIKEYLEDYHFFVSTYDLERQYSSKQAFFTITGAKEHIKRNGHHYNDPQPYISYINRNPELEAVANMLYAIATVPKENWNQEARRYYESEVLKINKEIFLL